MKPRKNNPVAVRQPVAVSGPPPIRFAEPADGLIWAQLVAATYQGQIAANGQSATLDNIAADADRLFRLYLARSGR